MEPEDLIKLGIAGMKGTIRDRQMTLYGCTGERKVGETFDYSENYLKPDNKRTFIVRETDSLEHDGRIYNCACFLCAMNERCTKDFLYCSGECFWDWRKDSKIVYFEELLGKDEKKND